MEVFGAPWFWYHGGGGGEAFMPKAFVMIGVHPGREAECQAQIRAMAGVQFVYEVTGVHDMIAFVDTEPYEELAVVVAQIRKLDGIRATDTELVLR